MKTATLLALVLLAAAAPVRAAQLRYAGALSDASGRPLDGSYLLRFSVVGDAAGESWAEQRYVRSEGGKFTAVLGSRKPLPDAALRGAYRLVVEAPPGTGWTVSAAALPEGAHAAAVYSAPPPAPPAPQASEPAADVRRLERELESARREREESKRRLEALERAVAVPAAVAAPTSRVYVVLPGETLRTVAKKTLGDERHWVLIYQANADRILRAGELAPGQKLVIPAGVR